jgi:2-polyprenyl-3-methyl-5-hydroxy-6-metoxy-1,4-benzoquinol methylase
MPALRETPTPAEERPANDPPPIWDMPWPSDQLQQVDACPICGSRRRAKFLDNLIDNVFFAARGRWTAMRCTDCRTVYLDPRPSPESIGAAYSNYYTHQPVAEDGGREPSPIRKAYRLLADAYARGRYWDSGILWRAVASFLRIATAPMAARQDSKYRWLPRHRPGLRLLDVGCGNGAFLKIARSIGWEAEGLDLDEGAVAVARAEGLRIGVGCIATLADREPASFDAITVNHVIEHVYDPRRDLVAAFRLLKPGGTLFLETPNIDARGAKLFGIHWRGMEPPRHLVLFTLESLTRLLEDIGFSDIRVIRRPDVSIGMWALSSSAQADFDDQSQMRKRHIPPLSLRLRSCLLRANDLEFITLTSRRP